METLFLERMKNDLKDDYEAFVESLSRPLLRGLRYDPRKIAGPGRHAIAAEIASKSDLFNCSGKAPAVLRSIYQ